MQQEIIKIKMSYSKREIKEIGTKVRKSLNRPTIDFDSEFDKIRALLLIHHFQSEGNKIFGFDLNDNPILSNIANDLYKYEHISDDQLNILDKKIPKYWRQVAHIDSGISFPNEVRMLLRSMRKNKKFKYGTW